MPSTERALTLPRPRWRGVSHLVAFVVAVPAGAAVTVAAPAGHARVAVGVFAFGIVAMFGASALVHRRPWSEGTYDLLFRLDHTGIFLAIAGTATPIAVFGLDGWQQQALLIGSWAGAAIGIGLEWMPFAPPRGMANTVFLTLGWLPILLVPWLWANTGPVTVTLLLVGGMLYTAGAIIVAIQRPDPDPSRFGYHEIFHALVIGAVVAHYAMVAVTLLPGAS
jgi:hemolysin III